MPGCRLSVQTAVPPRLPRQPLTAAPGSAKRTLSALPGSWLLRMPGDERDCQSPSYPTPPPPPILLPRVQICKEADGYQPHMLAPECGVRRLSSDALDLTAAPVHAAVQQVYTLLVNAARCAWFVCAPCGGWRRGGRKRRTRAGAGQQAVQAVQQTVQPQSGPRSLVHPCCGGCWAPSSAQSLHTWLLHGCPLPAPQGGCGCGGQVHRVRADGRHAHERARLQDRHHACHRARAG